jgi:large subunit ribosomal protein L6
MKDKNKTTIPIPEGYTAETNKNTLTIKKQEKQTTKTFRTAAIKITQNEKEITLTTQKNNKKNKATTNAIKTHIQNMLKGLEKEYEYKMEAVFSHFPMNMKINQNTLEINNLAGSKDPRTAKILENTKVTIKGKELIITSTDKEAAGQTAANIENATKIKGKDRRTFQDGIYITKKPK